LNFSGERENVVDVDLGHQKNRSLCHMVSFDKENSYYVIFFTFKLSKTTYLSSRRSLIFRGHGWVYHDSYDFFSRCFGLKNNLKWVFELKNCMVWFSSYYNGRILENLEDVSSDFFFQKKEKTVIRPRLQDKKRGSYMQALTNGLGGLPGLTTLDFFFLNFFFIFIYKFFFSNFIYLYLD